MRSHTFSLALLCAGLGFSCAAAAEGIPVDRVILSTSGLAQFEHHTQVTGDAAVEFPVRLDQVDDILKSLVIFDAKGRLGGVTLPGKQPLDQVFKDLPFNRNQLTSAMMLLNAYQGAVVTIKGADLTATGKIIQVVPEVVALGDDKTVTKHRLSLMTDAGLKQTILEDLQSLQFEDKKAQVEIEKALDAIRENSTSDRRTLTVSLLGKEQREVTLSYVVPAPLWKTAYRLVVPQTGKDKGLLQGWAVIENMTAADWKNVDLSLVSGNPVTFHQALYPSYYVNRPDIPVQVFGMTLPRVDQGTVASAEQMQGGGAMRDEGLSMKRKRNFAELSAAKAIGMNAPAAAPVVAMEMMAMDAGAPMPQTGMDQIATVAQAAQSAEATSQVLFRFPDRFNLAAGQSMMLPFVSRSVPMERVSLYQPDTNAKHPLAAVELKNDGDSSLPPGVLTLYEESPLLKGTNFVGDAQLAVLNKGEKRIVSYALDSKTTIDRADSSTATEGQFSASQGVFRTAMKNVMETTYTIKAPAEEDRTVVIEHPRLGADYRIVEPDPKSVEVTDTHYRLKVSIKAGETKTVKLVLENQFWQSLSIESFSVDQFMAYAANRTLKPEVQKAFAELAELRRALDEVERKMASIEERKQVIFQDQERVRENLKSLSVKSEVQQKYLDKLNAQEDQVSKLDDEHAKLQNERDARRAELQKKIAALSF